MSRRKRMAVIGSVIAAAAVARLLGVDYGLPSLFYHHDEPQIVLRALRYGTGDFNPHIFWWPGTCQINLMFVTYALMYGAGRILGQVTSTSDFAQAYFRDPTPFYLAGRYMVVAFGMTTILMLHHIGRNYSRWAVGAMAALLLAVNPLHVELSRVTLPTVPMVLWVVLSLWSSFKILESGKLRWYILAGVFAGLAASSLYYGGTVIVCVPLAHWLRRRAHGKASWRRSFHAGPLVAVAMLVLTFLAICPYALLDLETFRNDIGSARQAYDIWSRYGLSGLHYSLGKGIANLGTCLGGALTYPVAAASLAGLLVALFRRSQKDIIAAGFVVFYLAAVGLPSLHAARHLAPVVPLLLLFAAQAVLVVSERVPGRLGRHVACVAICALLALPSALRTARLDCEMLHEDTRLMAKRWIEANIPSGTKIVLDTAAYRNTATAPLRESKENIARRIEEIRNGTAEGYGWTSPYARYYEVMLECWDPNLKTYNQWWTLAGRNLHRLEYFSRNGYEYAMVNCAIAEAYLDKEMESQFPEAHAFYTCLDSSAVLVKEFSPEPWKRPGPSIRFYEIPR